MGKANGGPLLELHILEPPFYRNLCAFVWDPSTGNYVPYRLVPDGAEGCIYFSELIIPGLPVVTDKTLAQGVRRLADEEGRVRECGEAYQFSCVGVALFSGRGKPRPEQIAAMAGRKYQSLRRGLLLEGFWEAPEWVLDDRQYFVF